VTILVLNGGKKKDWGQPDICALLSSEILSQGHSVDKIDLEDIPIAPCTGCFGCWVRSPGECTIDDEGRNVAKAAIQCDLLVFLTPVTFGGYSSELKKAVDRLIPNLSPFFVNIGGETHHRPRYTRYPPILGVGTLEEPDPEKESIFRTLVGRNAVNYHSPFHDAVVIVPGREHDLREALRQAVKKAGGA